MGGVVNRVLTKLEGLKASQPNIEFVYKDMGAKKISEQLDYLGELFLTIGFQGATALARYPNKSTPINVAPSARRPIRSAEDGRQDRQVSIVGDT